MRATGKLLTLLAFVLALMQQTLWAYSEHCGTAELFQNLQNGTSNIARTISSACAVEDFYDSVYTRKTKHFEIFYTKTGPHATTNVFVDSIETAMEAAYSLYTKKQKTLPPKGASTTYHYQKNVSEGYYPIEVIELTLTRDLRYILNSNCNSCFALTVPTFQEVQGNSVILIDNDFKHPTDIPTEYETFKKDSTECSYAKPTKDQQNTTYNYSYAKKFGPGIRVTAFHELYHAIQLRYKDVYNQNPYWLESQGSAMEEIGAPDVDDYMQTLSAFFKMNWTNFKQVTNANKYALSVFFIGMHNILGETFNTRFLETASNMPPDSLSRALATTVSSFSKNPDSVFHDFAKRSFFSGARFQENEKLNEDQQMWPTMQVPANDKGIELNTSPYFTYRFTTEYPGDLPGKVSYLIKSHKDSTYKSIDVNSKNDYQKNYSRIFNADTSILVYSYLQNGETQDSAKVEQKLIAYPNPWKANVPLCFIGLPESENTIEIRTRKGSLIDSWSYSATQYCISLEEMNSKFAPGLYYYRTGQSGKMQKLIILK